MKFVYDVNVLPELISLIRKAEKYLILVSPYIDVWEGLKNEIRQAIKRGVSVQLYVRYETTGRQSATHHMEAAASLAKLGVQVFSITRLHSKVYVSEKQILTASMNLVSSSTNSSSESGVCWDRYEQPQLSEQVLQYIQFLEGRVEQTSRATVERPKATNTHHKRPSRTATKPASAGTGLADAIVQIGAAAVASAVSSKSAQSKARAAKASTTKSSARRIKLADDEGCCLRCGTTIDYDPSRPYCYACYTTWQRYGDDTYTEAFCHACGEEHETSMSRPLCRSCYRKHG